MRGVSDPLGSDGRSDVPSVSELLPSSSSIDCGSSPANSVSLSSAIEHFKNGYSGGRIVLLDEWPI